MLWSLLSHLNHMRCNTCFAKRIWPSCTLEKCLFLTKCWLWEAFLCLSLRNPNTKSVLNSFQVLFSFPRKTFWLKIVGKKATSNNTFCPFRLLAKFVWFRNCETLHCTFPSCMLTCGSWPTFPGIPQSGWILLQMADGGANVVRLLHMFGQSAELICGGFKDIAKDFWYFAKD